MIFFSYFLPVWTYLFIIFNETIYVMFIFYTNTWRICDHTQIFSFASGNRGLLVFYHICTYILTYIRYIHTYMYCIYILVYNHLSMYTFSSNPFVLNLNHSGFFFWIPPFLFIGWNPLILCFGLEPNIWLLSPPL